MPTRENEVESSEGSALDTLLPVLKDIPEDEILEPSMPVKDYLEEAHVFYLLAVEDEEDFRFVRFDWALVESLPERTRALNIAQSLWLADRVAEKEVVSKWKHAAGGAREFRDDLAADLAFAYRKDHDLKARASRVARSTTQSGLVQDLNNLAVLGRTYAQPLEAVDFDMSRLDRAAELSGTLSSLIAEKDGRRDKDPPKEIRDRAYTYLKWAVDEVLECGKHVFRKDPDRKRLYASGYWRG